MVDKPDKILIEHGPEFLVLDVIKQLWIDCRGYKGGKLEFLADIYSLLTIGQSIVFVGTKNDADMVHGTLSNAGYTCSVLHGSVDGAQRDMTMEAFRNGESNVLITTNVLARGVDVDNVRLHDRPCCFVYLHMKAHRFFLSCISLYSQVCLVINYDVPVDKDRRPDFETYLHRIGRTGRFGRKGTAISLIDDQASLEVLAAIEGHFSKEGKEMIKQAEADAEALADVIEI
jgi:ATP-dependent RNA helicase DDX19/DBP5